MSNAAFEEFWVQFNVVFQNEMNRGRKYSDKTTYLHIGILSIMERLWREESPFTWAKMSWISSSKQTTGKSLWCCAACIVSLLIFCYWSAWWKPGINSFNIVVSPIREISVGVDRGNKVEDSKDVDTILQCKKQQTYKVLKHKAVVLIKKKKKSLSGQQIMCLVFEL